MREPARRPVLVRTLLALGVLGAVGVGATAASWTDSATIGGSTFTGGTIDLKVDSVDAYSTTTLSMAAMVPGSSSAEVLTIRNAGTAPLRYNLAGGLTGADATAYGSAAALVLTIVKDGTRAGTGSSATCTGGTPLVSSSPLTTTTGTEVLALRGPLAASGTESLCVQVTLATSAPSTLQGRTASLTLTATATSDLGP